MLEFKIDKGKSEGFFCTRGVYFHGDLWDDLGYDLVLVKGCKQLYVPNNPNKFGDIPIGTYFVKVRGANPNRLCKAIIWRVAEPSNNSDCPYSGYIMYADDTEAYDDIKEFIGHYAR